MSQQYQLEKGVQLIQIAMSGDCEAAQQLLLDPLIDVNWAWAVQLVTALHTACAKDDPAVVKCLLQHPDIDTNVLNAAGDSPLHIASFRGCVEAVAALLGHPGIQGNLRDTGGFIPLSIACQEGHVGVVRLLLAWPEIEVNLTDNFNATPLFMACQEGQPETVSLMLADPKVDANISDYTGESPLYKAAQQGHLDVVRRLLGSKKNVDTTLRTTSDDPDEHGLTAAQWARLLGRIPRREWMEEVVYQRAQEIGPIIADLIDDYERDPVDTRHRLRQLPHLRGQPSFFFVFYYFSLTFALVPLISVRPLCF